MSNTTAPDASTGASEIKKNDDRPTAPPDTPNEVWIRRSILAAFWAVVILLGFPHWLWTTSVYRAELDVASADRWMEGEGCDMKYQINVIVAGKQLSESTQNALVDKISTSLNEQGNIGPYRYNILDASQWSNPHSEADLLVDIDQETTSEYPVFLEPYGSTLRVYCKQLEQADKLARCAHDAATHIARTMHGEMITLDFLGKDSVYAQQLEFKRPFEDASRLEKELTRAFKYASSYHLTFSLFTASSKPSSWAIESALQDYIHPLLASLSSISNFTVDTQVQYYSSFSPSMAGPDYDDRTKSWQLDRADLSGFINAAEWPLNPSIDAGPTMNFVLYVPSADKSPLQVADSTTNSWIIPQWGGVQILDRPDLASLDSTTLEPIMYTFADQLTALFGLPRDPASLQLRIKALTRQRIASLMISTSDTLGALIRLTEKLEQIAIPQSVAQAVSSSVDHLQHACQSLQAGQHKAALLHARRADEAVEKAFFEPSMVGQVYFPDEHKVAVYVPLLGPMAVPLVMATIKEIRQWRQRKVKTS